MTAAPPPSAPSALVDRYLQEQQATAVDRFARAHDASQADGDTPTGRYSALMPATAPAAGYRSCSTSPRPATTAWTRPACTPARSTPTKRIRLRGS